MAPMTLSAIPGIKQHVLILLALLTCLFSCVAAERLNTVESRPVSVRGSVDLILFGCRHPDDIMNAAFLDDSGDAYSFDIFAPAFDYSIRRAVPKEKALQEAEQFLECTFHDQQPQVNAVLGPEGQVLGYEVRPLYSPVRFGIRDVLNIEYRLSGNKVTVYVRLDPDVEAMINDQNNGGRDRR